MGRGGEGERKRVEYYSAMKKNEIMLFAATLMGLEAVILVKLEKNIYDIAYMWNKKNSASELIYKTEIELKMQKINFPSSRDLPNRDGIQVSCSFFTI